MLLVYPEEQCAEYAYDCIPKITSLDDQRNFYSFALYGAVVILAVVGLILIFVSKSHIPEGQHIPVTRMPLQETQAVKTGQVMGELNSADSAESVDPPVSNYEPSAASDDDNIFPMEVESTNNSVVDVASSLRISFAGISDEPFWTVHCCAPLVSLAWLSVPFLPMSGVFLKLGTLLAERLLYLPSVGWCMILALMLHGALGIVYVIMISVRDVFTRPGPGKRRNDILTEFQFFPRFVLVVVMVMVCWQYGMMTAEYNKIWKDSEALFVHGLKVCPRSAKLNLQVAKIYVNRGDYATGERFVNKAEEIDPEFCDVGYQKALITLFHYEDVEQAMSIAIDNLACPFSNVGSLELVTKLMDLQLSSNPRNHKVIAKHGELYMQGNMASMAIQKFQSAVTIAFEAGDFTDSVAYSMRAEKCVPAVLLDTGLQDWQEQRVSQAKSGSYVVHYNSGIDGSGTATQRLGRDHACFVDMLGGGVRAHIHHQLTSSGKHSNRKLGKVQKAQLFRKKELLLRAMQPSCIIFDPVTGRLQSSHAEKALNLLSNILVSEFNNKMEGKLPESYDIDSVEEFSRFAFAASQVYLLLANVTTLPVNADGGDHFVKNSVGVKFDQIKTVHEYKSKAIEMAQTALHMWSIAGKLHFYNGDYQNASDLFSRTLQWGMAGDDYAGAIGAPCSILYWYESVAVHRILILRRYFVGRPIHWQRLRPS
jgi:tetratricopeptide (TPR) repeat protein